MVVKVVEWLEYVEKLDQLITAKIAERDQLLDLAKKTTSVIDDMPRGSGGVSDKTGTIGTKLASVAEEYEALIDKYTWHKKRVERALERLPAKEYGVLHRQYIRYMTQEQIAEEMERSTVQIWRYRKKAIKRLENLIKCNEM